MANRYAIRVSDQNQTEMKNRIPYAINDYETYVIFCIMIDCVNVCLFDLSY